ncbi:serine hydrolase domain-containing protein [Cellulomonas massiliensis]|uniref:serine hydrolase domain-containing protein n=1 Tax=Cellulomonas massiliensis TaxID=1465811 RepID=UPI0002F655FB|nr:serine hydrolase domain-containing protein [Cellulomonas massiliensis]
MTTSPRAARSRPALAALAAAALDVGLVAAPAAATTTAADRAAAHASAAVPASPATFGQDPGLRRSLARLVDEQGFPAALGTVRDARGHLRHAAAGVADLRTGAHVPVDGQVRLGSNSKTFVAVVVLQLVAEGKVRLDAPLEEYLPGLVRGEGIDGRRITVRQVLQHTSGLPEYLLPLVQQHGGFAFMRDTYVQPRDLLDVALGQPATFAPGAGWAYSNTNYLVAGLLVERVTHRPLAEQVRTRVIERAGLRHTYLPERGEREIRGAHPRGYHAATPGGTLEDYTELDTSTAWAAGDVVGTPSDLVRLYTALLDGRLVPRAQLAEMTRTVETSPEWNGDRYGLGLVSHPLPCGGVSWGHGGDIPGFETAVGVTTDGRGAAVAVTALPSSFDPPDEAYAAVTSALDAALCP